MLTHQDFVEALRTGLMQLDDLTSLRHNPLLPLLCQPNAGPLALQQALVSAINEVALMDDPFATEAHEILYYRYVERLTQQQLAYQLGVSVRHLRRLQENALELLAGRLAQRVNLAPPPEAQPTPAIPSAVVEEIAWLHTGIGGESADLGEALKKAIEDAEVLANHYQIRVAAPPPHAPWVVAVPAPVLHQSLLTVLSWVMTQQAGRPQAALQVEWRASPYEAGVAFVAPDVTVKLGAMPAELEVARQLLASFGGSIGTPSTGALTVEVRVPRVGSVPVLVVDDNPDTRQLFQRYTAHSRFQVVATGDSQAVVALAQQHSVQAIVLDLMMPGMDGWGVLAQLRHHPSTQAIPIVICTILPQRQLAELLGAAAFLQKPVSRSDLLTTLTQVTAPLVTMPG